MRGADIAVLVASLRNQAINPVSGISHSVLCESVSGLLALADRSEDARLFNQEKLSLARSLLELQQPEPALETLHSVFRKYVVWPPTHPRRSQDFFFPP
jgi:hypothetical protein